MDTNFVYSRVDTAFFFDTIKKIRYINENVGTEFYIKFDGNDGIVETGCLKQGLHIGQWRRYDAEDEIIQSLNFDTLLIQADDILEIAKQNLLDTEDYEIQFWFDASESGSCSLKNHWIVSKEIDCKTSNASETTGISVCAITGKEKSYGFTILYSPALPKYDTPPMFDETVGSLDEFVVEHSRFPISEKHGSSNAVAVSFDISETGELKNISTISANTGYHKREALRLVKLMPNWLPAQLNRKAVESSHHVISINFQ